MAEVLRNVMRAAALGAVVACAAGWAGVGRGCEKDKAVSADVAPVKIGGKTFFLEVAAKPEVQFLGLGKRTHIEDNGGMIFVFAQPNVQNFVMRDCPIPIDILYLDGVGRVLSHYTMTPEPVRLPDEAELNDNGVNDHYEQRLKKYNSRFPSQIVVELQGGMIDKVGVKDGDVVQFDVDGLKKKLVK